MQKFFENIMKNFSQENYDKLSKIYDVISKHYGENFLHSEEFEKHIAS